MLGNEEERTGRRGIRGAEAKPSLVKMMKMKCVLRANRRPAGAADQNYAAFGMGRTDVIGIVSIAEGV